MKYFHWPDWLSVCLCSLPTPAHLLVSWIGETGKSSWPHSKNINVINIILVLNPKDSSYWEENLFQPKPGQHVSSTLATKDPTVSHGLTRLTLLQPCHMGTQRTALNSPHRCELRETSNTLNGVFVWVLLTRPQPAREIQGRCLAATAFHLTRQPSCHDVCLEEKAASFI